MRKVNSWEIKTKIQRQKRKSENNKVIKTNEEQEFERLKIDKKIDR